MNVLDFPVCLIGLVGTILLSIVIWRAYRCGRWFRLASVVLGLCALHFIGFKLAGPREHVYLYFTAGDSLPYMESAFKMISYDNMLSAYRQHGGGAELFRSFCKDWWNYYRWWDYATHPRWKLKYRPYQRNTSAAACSEFDPA